MGPWHRVVPCSHPTRLAVVEGVKSFLQFAELLIEHCFLSLEVLNNLRQLLGWCCHLLLVQSVRLLLGMNGRGLLTRLLPAGVLWCKEYFIPWLPRSSLRLIVLLTIMDLVAHVSGPVSLRLVLGHSSILHRCPLAVLSLVNLLFMFTLPWHSSLILQLNLPSMLGI